MKYDIVKLMARRKIRWKKRWVSGDSGGRLTFRSKKAGRLSDYRIYGQTIDGESVGDRTANLFDGNFLQGCWAFADGSYIFTITWVCTNKFKCKPSTTYTLSFSSADSRWYGFIWFTENGDYILSDTAQSPQTQCHYTATSPSNAAYMAIDIAGYPDTEARIKPSDVTDLMLVEGSTALPYEPCGYKVPVTISNGTDTLTTPIYLPKPIKMVGDEAEYIDYAEQKQHADADEEIEKQAATYMVSITPKTDVSKIEFVTMSSVPGDCTILTSGLIFTLDEADANTLNSTNYADGVRGRASTSHNYIYTWTKKYTEGQTYYIRPYVKYQTADNEIKEVYGDVYKADINGFERVRKNQLDATLPALPTVTGTNVLSVGTAVQPSRVEVKGRIKAVGQETEPEPETAEAEQE